MILEVLKAKRELQTIEENTLKSGRNLILHLSQTLFAEICYIFGDNQIENWMRISLYNMEIYS